MGVGVGAAVVPVTMLTTYAPTVAAVGRTVTGALEDATEDVLALEDALAGVLEGRALSEPEVVGVWDGTGSRATLPLKSLRGGRGGRPEMYISIANLCALECAHTSSHTLRVGPLRLRACSERKSDWGKSQREKSEGGELHGGGGESNGRGEEETFPGGKDVRENVPGYLLTSHRSFEEF